MAIPGPCASHNQLVLCSQSTWTRKINERPHYTKYELCYSSISSELWEKIRLCAKIQCVGCVPMILSSYLMIPLFNRPSNWKLDYKTTLALQLLLVPQVDLSRCATWETPHRAYIFLVFPVFLAKYQVNLPSNWRFNYEPDTALQLCLVTQSDQRRVPKKDVPKQDGWVATWGESPIPHGELDTFTQGAFRGIEYVFQIKTSCFIVKFWDTRDNVPLCSERVEEAVVLVDGAIGSTSTHSWHIMQMEMMIVLV